MSEEKSDNEKKNVDQLDFNKAIQATRSSVWRLFHYAVSDANKDLTKATPDLINKVVPALHKDPDQLTDTEINDLLSAYNDLSLLVYPATNESLWLKEKMEQEERAVIEGRLKSYSSTNRGVKNTYRTFLIILGIVVVIFFAFQAYTYFLSDTLQKVTEQESALKSIEDQIHAAMNGRTPSEGKDDNLESTPLFRDLVIKRHVAWLELNSSYCMLRKVSLVWSQWYPKSIIACSASDKNNPQDCKSKTDAELQKCEQEVNKTRETEEVAARDSFFSGTKAVLRVCNYLVLPTLLGLMGALAYVIRGILESFAKSSFILGARRRWGMRVILGPMLGLISGIVVSPDLVEFKEISFSPLVWAFLMGYSVEFAFSLFDSLIEKGRNALGSTNGMAEVVVPKIQQQIGGLDIQPPTSIPQVKSVQPSSGPASGGTEVVITGTGFTGDASVSFGSIPAKKITLIDNTQIVAISPPGEGMVNVIVTSREKASPIDSTNQFAYTNGSDDLVDDESDTHICDLDVPIQDITLDEELPVAKGGVA